MSTMGVVSLVFLAGTCILLQYVNTSTFYWSMPSSVSTDSNVRFVSSGSRTWKSHDQEFIFWACKRTEGIYGLAEKCTRAQESGEAETVRFSYEYHTHMMMVARQATCYIFELTQDEQTLVHDDAGMRHLELKILAQLNDPNLVLTTVPHLTLHSNILKQCGHGIAQYHIVQLPAPAVI